MSEIQNDNVSVRASEALPPGPHGEAALLLVESLIHGLLARSALTHEEAIEIVRSAIEVQLEHNALRTVEPAGQPTADRLLIAILESISIDLPQRP